MSIYYKDDNLTLYHGDSLEILPTLEIEANVLLTDPPYFKVKKDAWDNQWGAASDFLSWMGEWLDLAKPKLAANGSAYVFASPAMTTAVERVVGERFKVLNNIRWAKLGGDNLRRVSLPTMRSYVSIWEGIIFAEQFGSDGSALRGSGWADACAKLHAGVFEPLREYLTKERDAAGLTNRDIDNHLGTNGMAGHYFGGSQWLFPTHSVFEKLAAVIPFAREYKDLLTEHEALRAEYEALRRPFNITDRKMSEDIWFFHSVAKYRGKHPCEKPRELLRHMIDASSKPGDLILDPFAGSGSTLEAARQAGRRAVGIEQDERWCEHAANRLSKQALNIEDAA